MFKNDNIYVTPSRPRITDLDSLPFPDRSYINYEKYNQYINDAMVKHSIGLSATRGCPYNCIYCYKIWSNKHFVRSAEDIFEEVKMFYDMGVRRFSFVDDIFNLDVKNSTRFYRLLIKNKMKVHLFFPTGVRGDIMTKDYIDLMIEAGTINISVALETASPRLQKLIKKNLNVDNLQTNIQYLCEKYPQVITNLFTMIGFPTETEEEVQMTLDFIKSIRWIHFVTPSILIIFPHTRMEKIAIEYGISPEAILKSENLAFHELPETLPYDKSVAFNFKTRYLHEYFLAKERLLKVLPYQMKVLTEEEIVQKYNSHMSGSVSSFTQLLEIAGITEHELGLSSKDCLDDKTVRVPALNKKIGHLFPQEELDKNALKILLLDLSQSFSWEDHQLSDLVEPSLGLMYLLTYLDQRLKTKIEGKIIQSLTDFDNYSQLKSILEEFKPDILGIRTLSFFRSFFHNTVKRIRQWGYNFPIIVGGPYATSTYETVLQDKSVDLLVLGEGEITFAQLVEKIVENEGKLPCEEVLKEIPGIAFVPGRIDSKLKLLQDEDENYRKVKVEVPLELEDDRREILNQFSDDLESE
jgi:radical SAM superfamily enzyme YgiQ (UPF0313 family)